MNYLLDTCTVSDFVRGHPNVLARIKGTAPGLIAVSAITRMEIEFGLRLNPERAQ
jgi:tRNA(fMet)-specific endonuclease VapC